MNNSRRNKIKAILSDLDEIFVRLRDVRDEEELALDNIPENLQGSLRVELIEEGLENLEEAIDNLDEARERLEVLT